MCVTRVNARRSAPALVQPKGLACVVCTHGHTCTGAPGDPFLSVVIYLSIGWSVRNVGTADGSSTIVRYAITATLTSHGRRTGYVTPYLFVETKFQYTRVFTVYAHTGNTFL